jgi:hypothetical protein
MITNIDYYLISYYQVMRKHYQYKWTYIELGIMGGRT